MTLHQETITDDMRKVSKIVFDALDNNFYLAGGTALALQVGHRMSVDLDYFIPKDFNTTQLKNQLFNNFSFSRVEILFEEKNTLWCLIDGVKVSFISRFYLLLEPVEVVDTFRLAGLKDITVMKLSAICGREEYKDYFDLACISSCTDCRSWGFWWQTVYTNADMTSWLIALSAVGEVQEIPLETYENFKSKNIRDDIKKVVQEITENLKVGN